MEVFVILLIATIVFIAWCNASTKKDVEKNKQSMDAAQAGLGFFQPSAIMQSEGFTLYPYRILVDGNGRKVHIILKEQTLTYDYADIMGVEVVVDGSTVASRSIGSLVGASLVGGVIGAMAVDQNIKKKVRNVTVNIKVRNISQPVIPIRLLSTEVEDGAPYYIAKANEIADHIRVIIDQMEQEQRSAMIAATQTAATQPSIESQTPTPQLPKPSPIIPNSSSQPEPYSVADEIRKFKQLLDEGIISEQEFQDIKHSLLS